MPLTEKQAWAIAHLVHELRPDWNADGVVKQLKNLIHRRPTDVALACIRAAADLGAKTPGVIPTPGPHWSEGVTYEASRGPKPHEECRKHPGQWDVNCHSCRADHLAGDTTTTAELRRPDRAAQLAEARRTLAEARTALCPCGVDPLRCVDHRPTPTTEEQAEYAAAHHEETDHA